MAIGVNKIGIVYLAYVPFGISYLIKFIHSYKKHRNTLDHDLIIIFNGQRHEDEILPYTKYLDQTNTVYNCLISPEKFDIGSYFYAAECLKHEYLFFLNTYSEILCNDWLANLYQTILKPNVGVVGCTGAWADFGTGLILLKLNFFGAFSYWLLAFCNFNFNPTPHLRTNAFLIKRELFLSLKYVNLKPNWLYLLKYGNTETKIKTLHFEHGKKSMTNQLIKLKYKVLVIDKFGISYSFNHWMDSHTFWNGNQENLMIADNQTKSYELGTDEEKLTLRRKVWKSKRLIQAF